MRLEWRTGSELSNLGFHVYRGPSADGPWTRLTSSLIPGLGSSPIGQAYSWLDAGLANGVTYFYRLEDVDTASVSTFHGPVSATPVAAVGAAPAGRRRWRAGGRLGRRRRWRPDEHDVPVVGAGVSRHVVFGVVECTRHGDPDAVSYAGPLARRAGGDARAADGRLLGLEGAVGDGAGVRAGLRHAAEASAPALPLRRALVEAVVGKKVRLVSAEALDLRGSRAFGPRRWVSPR